VKIQSKKSIFREKQIWAKKGCFWGGGILSNWGFSPIAPQAIFAIYTGRFASSSVENCRGA